MRTLVFDTETTSLIDNHILPLDKQSHIIEFYGAWVDLATGEIERECHHIINPGRALTDFEIRVSKKSHGYTDQELVDKPVFEMVAEDIKAFIEQGPRPLAHNASFDVEITEIEFERLNQPLQWGGKPVCTVEQTVHLLGYRLSLGALHEMLFGERFADSHKAKADTQALIRVACELFKREEL